MPHEDGRARLLLRYRTSQSPQDVRTWLFSRFYRHTHLSVFLACTQQTLSAPSAFLKATVPAPRSSLPAHLTACCASHGEGQRGTQKSPLSHPSAAAFSPWRVMWQITPQIFSFQTGIMLRHAPAAPKAPGAPSKQGLLSPPPPFLATHPCSLP